MSLIAMCSGKGAPGTTFCAINLASALRRAGHDVLLLDLDPAGGDVAAYLGLDTRRGLFPLLRMDSGVPDPAALIFESEERAGVDAVCGFPEESALSRNIDLLASSVRRAAEERTVVCDLGRVTDAGARIASHADRVIVVVRPDLVSVLGAERALRTLASERVERDRIGVLVSGVERRRPADVTEVRSALGLEVTGSVPLHRSSARNALLSQMPVAKGPLAKAFDAMATAVRKPRTQDGSEEVAVA